MKENAAVLESGGDIVRIQAHGLEYANAPLKYQAKCLSELCAAHAALSDTARAEVDPLLDEHGCLDVLLGR